MTVLFVAAAIAAQAQPYRGELRERLDAPIIATLTSEKKVYDLEICVADALTVLGSPSVFRDGPTDVVIAASFPAALAYLGAVNIRQAGSGSRLEVRLRGKGWDDRLKARLAQCL